MNVAALLVAGLVVGPQAGAETPTVHVPLRQEVVLESADGTAAWVVDPRVAQAMIREGRVTVVGRAPGTTVLSVAGRDDVRTFAIVVDPTPAGLGAGRAAGGGADKHTTVQASYDSSTGRAAARLDVSDRSRDRTRRLYVEGRAASAGSTDAPVSLPAVSVELSSTHSGLVLFDSVVEQSPLTVDGQTVRGVHARYGPLRLHAGFASSLLYEDLILPAGAEAVAGLAYRVSRGGFTVTPAAFWFPTRSSAGGQHGVTGSLLVARGREGDPFWLEAELGYGGRWGAAAELGWDGRNSRLRLKGRHEPRGFASLGLGAPRGTSAEGAWSASAGPLSLNASGSLGRYELALGRQRSDAASGNVRLALSRDFFLSGGASLGWFDGSGGGVRALSVPAGLAYEGRHAGVSLLYRYQQNTASNRGGSGGRLGLRASGSRLRGSAFLDAQRQAPTLDFVLGEEPRLARLLADQGLAAQTPEDIARFLSANAPLLGHGYLEGVNVSLHPWRIQGGADLAWSLREDGRQKLRIHVLFDRTRAVAGARDTMLASLSYSHLVAGAELIAGYTWSGSELDGWRDQGSSFQISISKRFSGAPRLPWSGSPAITGVVFSDEQATGVYAPGLPPLAGARVRLNGSRVTTTDARGRFRFDDIRPGAQTVEAMLPAEEGAFFTTPSSLVVPPGARAAFGVSRTPARLIGYVRDDTGRGIPAVSVRLQGEGRSTTASSDGEGRYAFAIAEGAYVVDIDVASLPSGYDVSSLEPSAVRLRRAGPTRLESVVPAQRALSGRVVAGKSTGRVLVRLVELGRTAEAAADGRYAFRNLRPGTYTLEAVVDGRTLAREVQIPEGPVLLRDVDIDPARPIR